jgi:hypothetical protein
LSSRKLTLVHKVGGVLTDVASAKLSDPTGAFGVKRLSDNAVIVADGTDMAHDGTGLYSYTIAGLTPGTEYLAYVEYVYLGATNREPVQWVAGVDQAEGYYAKRQKILEIAGANNFGAAFNLDNAETVADETLVQDVMDRIDRYVDSRARYWGLAVEAGATTPHVIAATNADFGRISDLASADARVEGYFLRGSPQADENTPEPAGQMARMRKEAREELDEILSRIRQTQLAAAGGNDGIEVVVPWDYCNYPGARVAP